MIEIIPAIDIIDGKCVRLSQGDYSRCNSYSVSPREMAESFADAGIHRLHLVDLDGAKAGEPANLNVLKDIASLKLLKIEWGGGIKSRQALDKVFEAGADYAVIGSLAVKEPDLFIECLKEYGGDRIILGADIRDGKIAINGWLESSPLTIDTLIERYIPFGLKEVICTDISKDGMLEGPSTCLYASLERKYPAITFTVSGGISSMADIRELAHIGLPRVIVGKAIYENRISLAEIEDFIQEFS